MDTLKKKSLTERKRETTRNVVGKHKKGKGEKMTKT
jgi:hypothetical protein